MLQVFAYIILPFADNIVVIVNIINNKQNNSHILDCITLFIHVPHFYQTWLLFNCRKK